jgi:hypothetical protein
MGPYSADYLGLTYLWSSDSSCRLYLWCTALIVHQKETSAQEMQKDIFFGKKITQKKRKATNGPPVAHRKSIVIK